MRVSSAKMRVSSAIAMWEAMAMGAGHYPGWDLPKQPGPRPMAHTHEAPEDAPIVRCLIGGQHIEVPVIAMNKMTIWVIFKGNALKRHIRKHEVLVKEVEDGSKKRMGEGGECLPITHIRQST